MAEKENLDKNRVIEQLTRLETVDPTKVLRPSQRLDIALESSQFGIGYVARKYSLSPNLVRRTVRDVMAVSAYLTGKTEDLDKPGVKKKVARLKLLDDELALLKQKTMAPEIKRILVQVPHAVELLDYFFHFRTIKPLLDKLNIPYTDMKSTSVGSFLRGENISDSQKGLARLSRRYVFSKWLHGEGNVPDERISQAAEYVLTGDFSGLSRQEVDRLSLMKLFLIWAMDKEYKSMGGIQALPEDVAFFPSNYSGTATEAAETYHQYGNFGYCPAILKTFAGMVVKEIPWYGRIEIFGTNRFYGQLSLKQIDWAGNKFLEDTLISTARNFHWSMLMIDTELVLKEAKQKMLEKFKPRSAIG